jgi:hypothetical protein
MPCLFVVLPFIGILPENILVSSMLPKHIKSCILELLLQELKTKIKTVERCSFCVVDYHIIYLKLILVSINNVLYGLKTTSG